MFSGVIAGALLSLAGASANLTSEVTRPEISNKQWSFVCTTLRRAGYKEVDCTKTPKPIVVASRVTDEVAGDDEVWYGFTISGEDYIFVNPAFPEMYDHIIVHEAVHYVLTQTYGMRPMPGAVSFCESEYTARVVHHLYEGSPYDDSWRVGYGCVATLTEAQ